MNTALRFVAAPRFHEVLHIRVGHVRLSDKAGLMAAFRYEVWPSRIRHPNLHRTKPCHAQRIKLLPQYETDDGPLTAAQVRQIKKQVPQDGKRTARSSLFETETE